MISEVFYNFQNKVTTRTYQSSEFADFVVEIVSKTYSYVSVFRTADMAIYIWLNFTRSNIIDNDHVYKKIKNVVRKRVRYYYTLYCLYCSHLPCMARIGFWPRKCYTIVNAYHYLFNYASYLWNQCCKLELLWACH